jgi:signal transduction histidine kinase
MTIRGRWILAGGGVAAGIALGILAADAWNAGVDPVLVVADVAVGWAFMGGGIAAWLGRPASSSGRLMVAVGAAWFAGTIWPGLEFLHRGPLVHLLVTYPTARLTIRPSTTRGWIGLFAVVATYTLNVTRFGGSVAGGLLFGAALAWAAVDTLIGARGTASRPRSTAGLAAGAIGVVVVVSTVARLVGDPLGGSLLAYDVVLAVSSIVLAVDLLSRRWVEGFVAQVVVDLGDATRAGTVRDRLAQAIGDPSLTLGYAVGGSPGTFVDEGGNPIDLPPDGEGRVVTRLVGGDRETGFIAHDPAALDDPRMITTISAAAGLALSNSELQAQVRARVAEVEASRERLVLASDTQRRRLEQRLQAGTARRLGRVSELLIEVQESRPLVLAALAELLDEIERARLEIADFARGVHPATLTAGGLAPALDELVRRTPLRVDATVDAPRADPLIESTLYFVCTEAVGNAAKYASTDHVAIDVRATERSVALTIRDHGAGGAFVGQRGGLRGLADRVEALGGTFALDSPSGRGTRIDVTLPRQARAEGLPSGRSRPSVARGATP